MCFPFVPDFGRRWQSGPCFSSFGVRVYSRNVRDVFLGVLRNVSFFSVGDVFLALSLGGLWRGSCRAASVPPTFYGRGVVLSWVVFA